MQNPNEWWGQRGWREINPLQQMERAQVQWVRPPWDEEELAYTKPHQHNCESVTRATNLLTTRFAYYNWVCPVLKLKLQMGGRLRLGLSCEFNLLLNLRTDGGIWLADVHVITFSFLPPNLPGWHRSSTLATVLSIGPRPRSNSDTATYRPLIGQGDTATVRTAPLHYSEKCPPWIFQNTDQSYPFDKGGVF